MKPPTFWLRNSFLLLLLIAATFASGCVYLRLLQFKNQLADFEKHFAADLSDGFRINCKDPVLMGEDLRWLGAEPETIKKVPGGESWTVRWVKELPRGVTENGIYDVELHADLVERRLQSVYIPERYFAFVPKTLFLDALRSAGHAKIDRQSHQAVMKTSDDTADASSPVELNSVQKMLGVPTELIADSSLSRYRYVFRPQCPTGTGKSVEVTFIFNTKSGNLVRLIGKLPKGTLDFEFPEPAVTKK